MVVVWEGGGRMMRSGALWSSPCYHLLREGGEGSLVNEGSRKQENALLRFTLFYTDTIHFRIDTQGIILVIGHS